ncbi:hypothetical protein ABK040_002383 [Willaertia magna]
MEEETIPIRKRANRKQTKNTAVTNNNTEIISNNNNEKKKPITLIAPQKTFLIPSNSTTIINATKSFSNEKNTEEEEEIPTIIKKRNRQQTLKNNVNNTITTQSTITNENNTEQDLKENEIKQENITFDFSEEERDELDKLYGNFFFIVNKLNNVDQSDFTINLLNHYASGDGNNNNNNENLQNSIFTIEILQKMQRIAPELFTLFINLFGEVCIKINEDFNIQKRKLELSKLYKNRLKTRRYYLKENTEIIDYRKEIKEQQKEKKVTSEKRIEELLNKSEKKRKIDKTISLEELLKENDKIEMEEHLRREIDDSKFKLDRICETATIIYSYFKMSKKKFYQIEVPELVSIIQLRYTKDTSQKEIKEHLDFIAQHCSNFCKIITIEKLVLFEMKKDCNLNKWKEQIQQQG